MGILYLDLDLVECCVVRRTSHFATLREGATVEEAKCCVALACCSVGGQSFIGRRLGLPVSVTIVSYLL